jgi:hypothetical protein
VAWEVGGHIIRAKSWDDRYSLGRLPVGNDDLFEHQLNDAAKEQFQNASSISRAQILEFTANSGDETKVQETLNKHGTDLISEGLLWLCPGSALLRPTPWAARALLLRGCAGPARFLLRNCLVCAPLTRDILAACFELEAQERALCCVALPPDDRVSEKTHFDYNQFLAGENESVSPHYPEDCPAQPDSAWCFASFGEILQNTRCPGGSYRHGLRHRLRQLRNTLSHGHYVCWEAVQTVCHLRSELGFSG